MRKPVIFLLLILISVASAIYAETPRFVINSGHTDAVSNLAYRDSEDLLVSGSYDGTIKIWNSTDAEILYQLQVSHMPVRKVAVSPVQPYAAVIVSDGINSVNLSVWNWKTGEMVFRQRLAEIPLFIKFSPKGSFIVYGKTDFDSLVFLDAETGIDLNLIDEAFGIVSSVFISQSEKTLLTYNSSGSIQYWDLTNGTRKTRISTIPNLENISFTSSGRYMTGYNGRELLLIDLLKGNGIGSIQAANLAEAVIDRSSDRIVFASKAVRGIKLSSAVISGSGFGSREDLEDRNLALPTDILAVGGRTFAAFDSGAIYEKARYSDKLSIFSENNLLDVTDFAVNQYAMAITAPGKLLSISSDFFINRAEGIINPDAASKAYDIDPASRYGISPGSDSDFLLWETESAVGGTLRIFDSETGEMRKLTDLNAPLVSADYDSNRVLTLNKNGECRIIDYFDGSEEFKYSSFGLRTVDFIEGMNIVAGRNSSSTLSTPLLHINTRTGETVPIEDSDLLIFDLEYDQLTRTLYTLGFEERNGQMRTVLKRHTGRSHDRAETILTFPGEDIDSSFASDGSSSKIFTSLGYGGIKMLYWGGFTSLETTFSIPKTLKLRGNLLAALNKDSSFTIYNPSNGAKVMDLFIFKDLSWAALLDSNKFYVSPGAEQYINVYDGSSEKGLKKNDYLLNRID